MSSTTTVNPHSLHFQHTSPPSPITTTTRVHAHLPYPPPVITRVPPQPPFGSFPPSPISHRMYRAPPPHAPQALARPIPHPLAHTTRPHIPHGASPHRSTSPSPPLSSSANLLQPPPPLSGYFPPNSRHLSPYRPPVTILGNHTPLFAALPHCSSHPNMLPMRHSPMPMPRQSERSSALQPGELAGSVSKPHQPPGAGVAVMTSAASTITRLQLALSSPRQSDIRSHHHQGNQGPQYPSSEYESDDAESLPDEHRALSTDGRPNGDESGENPSRTQSRKKGKQAAAKIESSVACVQPAMSRTSVEHKGPPIDKTEASTGENVKHTTAHFPSPHASLPAPHQVSVPPLGPLPHPPRLIYVGNTQADHLAAWHQQNERYQQELREWHQKIQTLQQQQLQQQHTMREQKQISSQQQHQHAHSPHRQMPPPSQHQQQLVQRQPPQQPPRPPSPLPPQHDSSVGLHRVAVDQAEHVLYNLSETEGGNVPVGVPASSQWDQTTRRASCTTRKETSTPKPNNRIPPEPPLPDAATTDHQPFASSSPLKPSLSTAARRVLKDGEGDTAGTRRANVSPPCSGGRCARIFFAPPPRTTTFEKEDAEETNRVVDPTSAFTGHPADTGRGMKTHGGASGGDTRGRTDPPEPSTFLKSPGPSEALSHLMDCWKTQTKGQIQQNQQASRISPSPCPPPRSESPYTTQQFPHPPNAFVDPPRSCTAVRGDFSPQSGVVIARTLLTSPPRFPYKSDSPSPHQAGRPLFWGRRDLTNRVTSPPARLSVTPEGFPFPRDESTIMLGAQTARPSCHKPATRRFIASKDPINTERVCQHALGPSYPPPVSSHPCPPSSSAYTGPKCSNAIFRSPPRNLQRRAESRSQRRQSNPSEGVGELSITAKLATLMQQQLAAWQATSSKSRKRPLGTRKVGMSSRLHRSGGLNTKGRDWEAAVATQQKRHSSLESSMKAGPPFPLPALPQSITRHLDVEQQRELQAWACAVSALTASTPVGFQASGPPERSRQAAEEADAPSTSLSRPLPEGRTQSRGRQCRDGQSVLRMLFDFRTRSWALPPTSPRRRGVALKGEVERADGWGGRPTLLWFQRLMRAGPESAFRLLSSLIVAKAVGCSLRATEVIRVIPQRDTVAGGGGGSLSPRTNAALYFITVGTEVFQVTRPPIDSDLTGGDGVEVDVLKSIREQKTGSSAAIPSQNPAAKEGQRDAVTLQTTQQPHPDFERESQFHHTDPGATVLAKPVEPSFVLHTAETAAEVSSLLAIGDPAGDV
uniref:Uncharacterized protein n=1 Tax=Chromera velia CCMP2878 TaxID=1169474 RepID=A0A0G4HF62_9ALVE|eukprot:Cvel_26958.t1-p1 / transcript=Cvel_26958.t1 / gene=Cvel_26958 / organism=Chromera_velia_CCMP2878 / gene_product=hypothetical protein / transcript_product=hypothetical protein / location=Cvel_scaffold3286:7384-13177(+) / protein_length=1265 / sequence_SO=supercontig / SO=protein_coding / is_pseudo=false